MCAACRQMKPKETLLRIVLKDGILSLDETGKAPGRGMYICRNGECILNAKKRGSAERTFKCAADKEFYDKLLDAK